MVTHTQQAGEFPQIGFDDPHARTISVEETEDEALAAVLSSLGENSGASVRIYRQGGGGYRDVTFLTEWMPSEYSLTRLQGDYGGGTYRIHVRQGGQLLANSGVKVEARKDMQAAPPVRDPALSAVQAQIAALVALVEKVATVQAPPVAQQSRMDWLKELQVMQLLFGGGQSAPRAQDPFDMLTKMLVLQKELGSLAGGGGDAEPGTMSVLMKAMETFAPVLQNAAAGRAAPAVGYQANPMPPLDGVGQPFNDENTLPSLPVAAAAPGPAPATNQETDMLRMYVMMLIAEAAQGIDPEAYALLITQKLQRDQIDELLKPDNWFERLAEFEPKVSPHREWFSDLRDIVFEILTQEGMTDTTGTDKSGGTNHASAGNANSNTPGNT
jgi:hypothetical protein